MFDIFHAIANYMSSNNLQDYLINQQSDEIRRMEYLIYVKGNLQIELVKKKNTEIYSKKITRFV